MPVPPGELLGRVALRFDAGSAYVPKDLSAAARASSGAYWFAADERAAIERLEPTGPHAHALGKHRCFPVSHALGVGEDEEVDIEGFAMDHDDAALWLIGSHSARRKTPRGEGTRRDLARLATVRTEGARFVLARLEMKDNEPVLTGRRHGPAILPAAGEGSLLELLAEDEHLAPFLPRAHRATRGRKPHATLPPIPGKDNGFDIEGIGFFEGRILIGLRGPVLRGWAFVLDIELVPDGAGSLTVKRGKNAKRGYRKHALDLDGLGVRELIVRGDDVFVLAGPTMALDGAHRLFHWKGGPSRKADAVVHQRKSELVPVFDLPWGPGVDRAEGIARFDWFDEDDSILVVYDAPRDARKLGRSGVLADVFAL